MKRSSVIASQRMRSALRPVVIEFKTEDGEVLGELNALVRPNGLSPEVHATLLRLDGADPADMTETQAVTAIEAFATAVSQLVVSWDLTDDDDQPIAPTVRNLSTFGLDELIVWFHALQEAAHGTPS